jgi:acetamidase/formamidase
VTGDGEVCVSHIDTEAEVIVNVDLIKKEHANYVAWPQIEYPDRIGSIGCPMSGSLYDAYKAAYFDLTSRLANFYGFDLLDAYQLLGSVGEIRVNQGIDPYWHSCVAKILKKYIS